MTENRRTKRATCAAVIVTIASLLAPAGHAVAAACHADSGTTRAALVELYTSEGCSSCPPADRALAKLTGVGARVVPIAFHVDYWDSIGWKDPYAQAAFAERQAWEVRANGHRTSFTPHFFVDGGEVQDWRGDLDSRLRAPSASPPARIVVDADARGRAALHVRVDGTLVDTAPARGPVQLFVAVTESGLSSQVDAGENRGARLAHEAVVRRWIGPIVVGADRRVSFDRDVDVPTLGGGRVAVVAFLQNASTAEVLQAVGTGPCVPPPGLR